MATLTRSAPTSVDLHYTDHGGDGRPVVLVHGWPLSEEAWADQVPALQAAGNRVVTYDRRGFGQSSSPGDGHDYDTMATDLAAILDELDLRDAVLVGFSMGGGEVARYIGNHGTDRLAGAVFASAVPPYLLQTDDNPEGPLDEATIQEWKTGLQDDRKEFFRGFVSDFYTVDGEVKATEQQEADALELCLQSDQQAALDCIDAFARTDFRDDLRKVDVPTLVLHGDSDGVVPFEASGQRTEAAVASSRLHLVEGGPHGINVTHADEFNTALVDWIASI